MDESRWRKHVTWDDPDEIVARYEEISSKVDNALNPLRVSEIQSGFGSQNLQKTPQESLRTELDHLSLSYKPRTPSKSLQNKHEKLKSTMKDMQVQCVELSWTDIITNSEVRAFLSQYFPRTSKISSIDFISFVEFEYPHYLTSENVKSELIHTLSIDESSAYISLNALEILTKDQGLEELVRQVFEKVDESVKASKEEINSQILQEMAEVKEMLDKRSLEIDRREVKVIARENKLIKLENSLMTEFKDKLEKMAATAKDKLNKEIAVQMKRMQGLERNLSDMVKMTRSKQQSLTRSELSMKTSSGGDAGKLKARISSLEKSNDCLKTKLSILEMENKSDKQTITRLTDEISRIKARSSMLEQSLSSAKRQEPEKPPEPPKEEEKKPPITYTEVTLALSLIHTLISCCKLTLPVLHTPSSPRSHKQSILEDSDSSLGEIFFPAFNKLVPSLIESLPFIHKLKKKQEQTGLLKFLWEILMYAWNDASPSSADRKFNPNNLQFEPSTQLWKQKLQSEKAKDSRRPVYHLFADLKVHKVLGSFLIKWMKESAGVELGLIAAFLTILTSTSRKRMVMALEFIKKKFIESFREVDIKSSVNVLVALLDSPDEISGLACEVVLSLSVDFTEDVINQCCNEGSVFRIADACKKALVNGVKCGVVSDLEEGLVVLLQKLSAQEYLQGLFKAQGLSEILAQREQCAQGNTFFSNNIKSIIRNLNN